MAHKQETSGGLRELALFAGAGGGILGGKLLGWRTVCAVEFDEHARAVLAARQNDGCLEPFPIWDDVRTFDGKPWRGIVDVVSGGFPCQDISAAGKGAGITGERSGLWSEMARIICEVRPRFAFVENSPMLTSRGLGTVLGDLAAMGYDARWCVLGAIDAGAPHRRERIWIMASDSMRERNRGESRENDGSHEKIRKDWITSPHEAIDKNTDDSNTNGGNIRQVINPDASEVCQPNRVPEQLDEPESANAGNERNAREPFDGSQARSSWWATEPDVGGKTDGLA